MKVSLNMINIIIDFELNQAHTHKHTSHSEKNAGPGDVRSTIRPKASLRIEHKGPPFRSSV